jgi:hypothetical protein
MVAEATANADDNGDEGNKRLLETDSTSGDAR